jgi:hypothetical protein
MTIKVRPLSGLRARQRGGSGAFIHYWAPRGHNGPGDGELNYLSRKPRCGIALAWREAEPVRGLTTKDQILLCQNCYEHWHDTSID